MAYWLMKSEPSVFSIQDLARVQQDKWDGVRNYQARNFLRDTMQKQDLAFFYHSNAAEIGIVGTLEIISTGYPDPTAFDPTHPYYDPQSKPEKPRWYCVDVAFHTHFPHILTLEQLKQHPFLANFRLLQRGNRLSILPVTPEEWSYINNIVKK